MLSLELVLTVLPYEMVNNKPISFIKRVNFHPGWVRAENSPSDCLVLIAHVGFKILYYLKLY